MREKDDFTLPPQCTIYLLYFGFLYNVER